MPMRRVYFATNRNRRDDTIGPNFGEDFAESDVVSFGAADVNLRKNAEDMARKDMSIPVGTLSINSFKPSLREEIIDGPDTLIISVHGFDYEFFEATIRTAWVANYYSKGRFGFESSILLFSWPSLGAFSPTAYKADVKSAQACGGAFVAYFKRLAALVRDYRKGKPLRRVALLAHSLAGTALSSGIPLAIGREEGQYDPVGKDPLFDAAILVAADADDNALGAASKLKLLGAVSSKIVTYYTPRDIALIFAGLQGRSKPRLGERGGGGIGPSSQCIYKFHDVTRDVSDFADDNDTGVFGKPNEDTKFHQYYRYNDIVRDRICREISGAEN
jgi:esterase/lipase superfamily enzyme